MADSSTVPKRRERMFTDCSFKLSKEKNWLWLSSEQLSYLRRDEQLDSTVDQGDVVVVAAAVAVTDGQSGRSAPLVCVSWMWWTRTHWPTRPPLAMDCAAVCHCQSFDLDYFRMTVVTMSSTDHFLDALRAMLLISMWRTGEAEKTKLDLEQTTDHWLDSISKATRRLPKADR